MFVWFRGDGVPAEVVRRLELGETKVARVIEKLLTRPTGLGARMGLSLIRGVGAICSTTPVEVG